MIAHIRFNDLGYTRMGTAVTKRGRTAVVRNHLRRMLREAFRLERPTLPAGLDIVLLPPRRTRALVLTATRESLRRVCEKAVAAAGR